MFHSVGLETVKGRGSITQPAAPTTVDVNCACSTVLVLLSLTFQAIMVALFTLMLTCTHSYRPTVRVDLYYTWVSNFGHFLASRTGLTYVHIDLYASIYSKSYHIITVPMQPDATLLCVQLSCMRYVIKTANNIVTFVKPDTDFLTENVYDNKKLIRHL